MFHCSYHKDFDFKVESDVDLSDCDVFDNRNKDIPVDDPSPCKHFSSFVAH